MLRSWQRERASYTDMLGHLTGLRMQSFASLRRRRFRGSQTGRIACICYQKAWHEQALH